MSKRKNNNGDLPFAGASFPEEHGYQGAGSYPFVQWVNGNRAFARLHPVLGSGGWAMPAANVLGELEWDRGELPHKNGRATDAYLAESLHVVLLAEKFRWFKVVNGRTRWLVEYEDGARGKYQVLVVVREAGEAQTTPWMLTATGLAGKALYQAFKAYRSKVLPAASSMAKKHLPLYSFWLEIAAGEPRQVGAKPNVSTITPPVLVTPDLSDPDALREYLVGSYAGQEALDRASAWFDEAQGWAKAKFRTADGRPVSEHGEILEDDEDVYGPPLDDEMPPGLIEADDAPF
jgi:hypothetical protein